MPTSDVGRARPGRGDNRAAVRPADGLGAGVGLVIGTGVFALPSALAGYGPISLVALVPVTIGSIALALTFRALSGRTPGLRRRPEP